MANAQPSSSEAESPLLRPPRSPLSTPPPEPRYVDITMQELLKKPEDAIGYIEQCGVTKLGEMEIDVRSLPPCFVSTPFRTTSPFELSKMAIC